MIKSKEHVETTGIPSQHITGSGAVFLLDSGIIGETAPMIDSEMQSIDELNYSLKSLAKENGTLVIFSCNTCPFVVGNEDFEGWEKQYNDLSKKAKDFLRKH